MAYQLLEPNGDIQKALDIFESMNARFGELESTEKEKKEFRELYARLLMGRARVYGFGFPEKVDQIMEDYAKAMVLDPGNREILFQKEGFEYNFGLKPFSHK